MHRPAIYNFFLTEVYGRQPEQQLPVRFELLEQSDEALGGKATRKQVAIHVTPQRGSKLAAEGYEHTILLLIYQPNNTRKPVPAFVGMNFKGNHQINADPAIIISPNAPKGKELGSELLIPSTMLRHEQDRFLDDVTREQVEQELSVSLTTTENDGFDLLEKILSPAIWE